MHISLFDTTTGRDAGRVVARVVPPERWLALAATMPDEDPADVLDVAMYVRSARRVRRIVSDYALRGVPIGIARSGYSDMPFKLLLAARRRADSTWTWEAAPTDGLRQGSSRP